MIRTPVVVQIAQVQHAAGNNNTEFDGVGRRACALLPVAEIACRIPVGRMGAAVLGNVGRIGPARLGPCADAVVYGLVRESRHDLRLPRASPGIRQAGLGQQVALLESAQGGGIVLVSGQIPLGVDKLRQPVLDIVTVEGDGIGRSELLDCEDVAPVAEVVVRRVAVAIGHRCAGEHTGDQHGRCKVVDVVQCPARGDTAVIGAADSQRDDAVVGHTVRAVQDHLARYDRPVLNFVGIDHLGEVVSQPGIARGRIVGIASAAPCRKIVAGRCIGHKWRTHLDQVVLTIVGITYLATGKVRHSDQTVERVIRKGHVPPEFVRNNREPIGGIRIVDAAACAVDLPGHATRGVELALASVGVSKHKAPRSVRLEHREMPRRRNERAVRTLQVVVAAPVPRVQTQGAVGKRFQPHEYVRVPPVPEGGVGLAAISVSTGDREIQVTASDPEVAGRVDVFTVMDEETAARIVRGVHAPVGVQVRFLDVVGYHAQRRTRCRAMSRPVTRFDAQLILGARNEPADVQHAIAESADCVVRHVVNQDTVTDDARIIMRTRPAHQHVRLSRGDHTEFLPRPKRHIGVREVECAAVEAVGETHRVRVRQDEGAAGTGSAVDNRPVGEIGAGFEGIGIPCRCRQLQLHPVVCPMQDGLYADLRLTRTGTRRPE